MGKTLVDTQHDEVPVRVLNLEQQPRLISKGTLLASCEPVLRVQSGSLLTHLENDSHELPVCVKSLYDRATEGLNLGQSKQLYVLLQDFSDLFSKGTDDLGSTDLVTHTINTGDAQPLRQPPRRVPLAMREVAEMVVQAMLSNGQIEPSNSPWVSPVMLVKKRMGAPDFVWTTTT